jgi:hypothetical protein
MNPPGWTDDEPCPDCGSWDITEWEIRINAVIHIAWECRDCGYLVRWSPSPTYEGGGEAA